MQARNQREMGNLGLQKQTAVVGVLKITAILTHTKLYCYTIFSVKNMSININHIFSMSMN